MSPNRDRCTEGRCQGGLGLKTGHMIAPKEKSPKAVLDKIKKIDIESGKIARTSLQIGYLKSRKSARQRPRNDPNNRAQIDRRGNQYSSPLLFLSTSPEFWLPLR